MKATKRKCINSTPRDHVLLLHISRFAGTHIHAYVGVGVSTGIHRCVMSSVHTGSGWCSSSLSIVADLIGIADQPN